MAANGADKAGPATPSPGEDKCWHCRTVHAVEQIWPIVDEVAAALKSVGFGPKEIFAARLALEEAISNGVKHGNRKDPHKTVQVRFHVDDREFWAEVEDEGPGFNPATIPDPRTPENLEREGGRGILLIRRYMTRAEYNERGNCLHLSLLRH